MNGVFGDVMAVDDVLGVVLLSPEGAVLFRHLSAGLPREAGDADLWRLLSQVLEGVDEAEVVFEERRIYVRDAGTALLVILLGPFAPVAMVRLQCETLLPSLRGEGKPTGIGRFFRKRS